MNRRTLNRSLAVAVAIAAISPLFASDLNGCARSGAHTTSAKQNLSSQGMERHHR